MKPGKTASGSVAIALYESYDFFALISAIVKFYEDEHMKELSIQVMYVKEWEKSKITE